MPNLQIRDVRNEQYEMESCICRTLAARNIAVPADGYPVWLGW